MNARLSLGPFSQRPTMRLITGACALAVLLALSGNIITRLKRKLCAWKSSWAQFVPSPAKAARRRRGCSTSDALTEAIAAPCIEGVTASGKNRDSRDAANGRLALPG